MSADEALSQLITDSGDRLLRLAYQLTHDRAAAEESCRRRSRRSVKRFIN